MMLFGHRQKYATSYRVTWPQTITWPDCIPYHLTWLSNKPPGSQSHSHMLPWPLVSGTSRSCDLKQVVWHLRVLRITWPYPTSHDLTIHTPHIHTCTCSTSSPSGPSFSTHLIIVQSMRHFAFVVVDGEFVLLVSSSGGSCRGLLYVVVDKMLCTTLSYALSSTTCPKLIWLVSEGYLGG